MQKQETIVPSQLDVVDSHTAGEPTRVVVNGEGCLPGESLLEQRDALNGSHACLARAVLDEPRGSDILVGAWLLKPSRSDCEAAVIFFNNVGALGMCGHGTIGVVETLAYLGRITPGEFKLETPVGVITVSRDASGDVSVRNVPAYRHQKAVALATTAHGVVTGDIAWGGNWFFLADVTAPEICLANAPALTALAVDIDQSLIKQGMTGADGTRIDHIELSGASPGGQGRNFVLCPGHAYDRSPCGTGTSAKVACLAADGRLAPGEVWRQEGLLGTVFDAWYEEAEDRIVPTIRGRAFITGTNSLRFDAADPFRCGIPYAVRGET